MSSITSITRQELQDIGFRPDGSQLLPAQRKNSGNHSGNHPGNFPGNHPGNLSGNLPNDLPADQTAVKIIPRKKNVRSIAAAAEKRLLKAAAYCRVSTLMESQETSISAQRRHYDQLIRSHPEWELAGIYLEAGVTGTRAETRPELQRLIADCKAGKVNLILTKSISRFSRNTSDCIEMVRMLTSLGVDIFFEKEKN